MNEFARRLKEARVESKLTQEELAKILDVAKSTISMWENGNRIPSLSVAYSLSKVLNKPPSFFIGDSVRILPNGSAAPGFAFRDSEENEWILFELIDGMNDSQMHRLLSYAKFLLSEDNHGNED